MGTGASTENLPARPVRVTDVELGPTVTLRAPDHSALHSEKRVQHLAGTRQWVFDEFSAWLKSPTADKLFWLMGGGGTGARPATASRLSEPCI